MKLRYYIDIYPGINFSTYIPYASPNPPAKAEGTKRFAFDVTIPDHLIYDIDAIAPEVSKLELVIDHTKEET